MAEKLAPEKRHSFVHNGQKVFEWDQTLEEVNMYISLPPNVPSKQFFCKIQSKHVEVGIKGNPPYLSHDLTCPVKTDCSFWTLEDDIMHITLQKRDKGQTWASPIVGEGGQLDPYSTDLEQKRLQHDLTCPVKTDCSFWTLEDDIMHITLQKRDKGQTWASPIVGEGGQLDPYSTDLEQKRLQHDLTCPVKTDCSFWTLEDDIMHITLQKRDKGQTWASPIVGEGGQLDPYSTDLEQKRLQHDLTCPVKTDCSFWTLEDDIMHITLQKRDKGQTWASPIVGEGGQLDPYSTDLEQKRLQHDLTCPVKTDCSFWTLEDDIMHITLQKRDKGQTWASPIVGEGGQLDPYSTDLEQKRLMLQRFQEENPGFDFSQAQFTGGCPDPRTFMGGIRSD